MTETISFRLNGKPTTLNIDGDRLLLWVLRTDLGLTGTKEGCGRGECGACTILLDGSPVNACLLFAAKLQGAGISTTATLLRKGATPKGRKEVAFQSGINAKKILKVGGIRAQCSG